MKTFEQALRIILEVMLYELKTTAVANSTQGGIFADCFKFQALNSARWTVTSQ